MIPLTKVCFLFSTYTDDSILTFTPIGTEDFGVELNFEHIKGKVIAYGHPQQGSNNLVAPKLYCAALKSDLFKDIRFREETEYEFTFSINQTKAQVIEKRKINPVYPFS